MVLNEAPLQRLDPRYALGAWDTKVSRLIAPGLTTVDNLAMRPENELAESVVAEDDVTYVVTLRADSRFPDGRVVDAEDVLYTYRSMADPLLGCAFRKTFDEILAGVDVLDARRVRFRLKRPRAPFITDLDLGIVDRQAARPLDDAVRAAARAGKPPPPFDPATEVVGAGPFRIVERSGDRVVLGRNPHARVPPRLERAVIRTIRDDNARFLALMGGSADLIQNGITPLVLESFEKDPRLHVQYGRSAMITYLGFNLDDPVLARPLVRQAIAHAIDRERIVASKFRGHALLATGMLDPGHPGYAADVPRWPFDPAAARRLLDQAGFPDPDGNGPLPRLRLTWKTSAQRFRVALAHVMKQQLGEVGIEIEIRPFDFATFFDDVKKGSFQMFSLQATDVVEPDLMRAFFHSSRIPTAATHYSGNNRFRYRNREVDDWLDRGAAVRDPDERRRLYAEVQRAIARDLPMVPLWHEDNVVARRAAVRDYQVMPTARLGGLATASKAR